MLALHNLQTAFSQAMTLENNQDVISSIKTDESLPVSVRLDIYRNNITSALIRGLEGLYPTLRVLMGSENFTHMAKQYISHIPPTTGHALDYGNEMSAFITGQEALQRFPFLPDVAHLEWCWHECYGAVDAEVLNPEALTTIAPEEIVNYSMTVHPSARFLRSEFPISKIWSAISSAEETENEDEISLPDIDGGGEWIMIVRPDFEVEVRQLDASEYEFLQQLNNGQSIAQSFAHAAHVDSNFDLSNVLASHLSSGSFIACVKQDHINR